MSDPDGIRRKHDNVRMSAAFFCFLRWIPATRSDTKCYIYNELDRAYPTQKSYALQPRGFELDPVRIQLKTNAFMPKKSDFSRFSQSIESSCEKARSF